MRNWAAGYPFMSIHCYYPFFFCVVAIVVFVLHTAYHTYYNAIRFVYTPISHRWFYMCVNGGCNVGILLPRFFFLFVSDLNLRRDAMPLTILKCKLSGFSFRSVRLLCTAAKQQRQNTRTLSLSLVRLLLYRPYCVLATLLIRHAVTVVWPRIHEAGAHCTHQRQPK